MLHGEESLTSSRLLVSGVVFRINFSATKHIDSSTCLMSCCRDVTRGTCPDSAVVDGRELNDDLTSFVACGACILDVSGITFFASGRLLLRFSVDIFVFCHFGRRCTGPEYLG